MPMLWSWSFFTTGRTDEGVVFRSGSRLCSVDVVKVRTARSFFSIVIWRSVPSTGSAVRQNLSGTKGQRGWVGYCRVLARLICTSLAILCFLRHVRFNDVWWFLLVLALVSDTSIDCVGTL